MIGLHDRDMPTPIDADAVPVRHDPVRRPIDIRYSSGRPPVHDRLLESVRRTEALMREIGVEDAVISDLYRKFFGDDPMKEKET